MPLVWVGRIALGLLGVKALSSAENMTDSARKAAPWVVAGLVAYATLKRGR